MYLPPNKTEGEVLEAIEKAVKILAPSFVFGYHDLDDIKQHARMLGLLSLKKYDPSRPLENFVYRHIRNRLINFKRDNFRRNDPPCAQCHNGDFCTATGGICKEYGKWLSRNNAKANLMRPLNIGLVSDERESRTRHASTAASSAELAEMLDRIDAALPVELRSYYLQMRDGVAVPKAKRQLVMDVVRAAIQEGEACH